MPSRLAPMVAFLALAAVLAAEAAFYLPRLPARIATHFDASGAPNGWASPSVLSQDIALLTAIFAAIFLGAGLLDHVPMRMINLPGGRRELDAAQEKAAKAYLRDWIRWFVVLTVTLFALVIGRVLAANLAPEPRLGNEMWVLLGAYLVADGAMLLALIRRFRA
ncbi:DUF1648 domain-containing protein [Methylocystis parvus]|uniref:DUF1648 domain-containing protein n=1 Tax=Methylocystis parvus TaxID=134 RepID=UPI003C74F417